MDSDKVQWTLDLIEKLKAAEIGEPGRLDSIKNLIENGKTVFDSDKNYLKSKFEELNQSGEKQIQPVDEISTQKTLYIIGKLREAEIGDPKRLDIMKSLIENNIALEEDDSKYLSEKYEQLKKVDDSEEKIHQQLEIIEKLKEAEIGNAEKLDECKNALNESGELTEENESYLQSKIQQYKKIHAEPPKPVARPDTEKKIVKKFIIKPVDPDAKFCAFCERSIRPERDFSVGALIVLLFIGIIPGIIYYFLKSPVCPICKHSQWRIPPDDHDHS